MKKTAILRNPGVCRFTYYGWLKRREPACRKPSVGSKGLVGHKGRQTYRQRSSGTRTVKQEDIYCYPTYPSIEVAR